MISLEGALVIVAVLVVGRARWPSSFSSCSGAAGARLARVEVAEQARAADSAAARATAAARTPSDRRRRAGSTSCADAPDVERRTGATQVLSPTRGRDSASSRPSAPAELERIAGLSADEARAELVAR